MLIKHIVSAMNWKQPLLARAEPENSVKQSIVGRYLSPFDQVVTIEQQGEQLVYTNPMGIGGAKYQGTMIYQGAGKFALNEKSNFVGVKVNPASNETYLVTYRDSANIENFAMRKLDDSELLPFEVAMNGDVEQTISAYKSWQKNKPNARFLSANALNNAGYSALGQKNYLAAINFFTVYTTLYPEDANAYDSLGEAYMTSGEYSRSIALYQKSLLLNPKNSNAEKMIKAMQSKT